jgi:hypothetical protein
LSRALALLALLSGCTEYAIHKPPVVPPAKPPGADPTEFGDPPDWQDCYEGWLGSYSNLAIDHPDVEPGPNADAPDDPYPLDWWDDVAFETYDPDLDFGANWWPVDEGLEADPSYFSGRWLAWVRAWSDTEVTFVLGSSDDSWVLLDEEQLAALPGTHPYEPQEFRVTLESGQYPLEVRYAHRASDSGFQFRVISGDVSICYPEFSEAAR